MKPSKKAASTKRMRVATVFTGAAACAVAFAPAAAAAAESHAVAMPGDQSRLEGFVPHAPKVFTATGCQSHVCIGVYGGGLYVSHVAMHFWGKSGCHIPDWQVWNLQNHKEVVNAHGNNCLGSKQNYSPPIAGLYSVSVNICVGFWNVVGLACEVVHP
jgi:hypothetical protein